jgi:hypothetical protein
MMNHRGKNQNTDGNLSQEDETITKKSSFTVHCIVLPQSFEQQLTDPAVNVTTSFTCTTSVGDDCLEGNAVPPTPICKGQNSLEFHERSKNCNVRSNKALLASHLTTVI